MTVIGGTILQLTSAPCLLTDEHGNIYAGFALVELELEYDDDPRTRETKREILPFGTEGSLIGLPAEAYYKLHALGDQRPEFAEPILDIDAQAELDDRAMR